MGRFLASGIALALLSAMALTGCATDRGSPAATPGETRTPRPSSTASVDPDSAEGRLALFDETNAETIAAGSTGGRDFIDALVAAGFDKSAMEVTADNTAIGLAADNIQFSVQLGAECLVGQYGNVGYHSTIQPALESSGCLIGSTRPIDW